MPIELVLPRMSDTMLEGSITRWLKREGDEVVQGEPLVEVETDKALVEISAAATGRLLKILAPEGNTVPVGAAFALIETGDQSPPGTEPANAPQGELTRDDTSPTPRPRARRVQASPVARRLAQELGVSLESLNGSGPEGIILESDVRRAARVTAPQAAPEEDIEIVPLVGMRKVTALRMLESRQTTAQVTTFMDVDISRVGELRREVGATYTAFVVAAVARTLPDFPYLNASLEGERIMLRKRIHIGVAVAAEDALIVPVLRNADKKSLGEIAGELRELAEKGRQRRLTAQEMDGATFTVTNPGVFGSLFSTPIINLPQAAILGTGRVHRAPVVRGDEIVIGDVMYLSLSYDHRLIDGGPAVQFLRKVKELLENPEILAD